MKCFFCDATGVDHLPKQPELEPVKCKPCNGTGEVLPQYIQQNMYRAAAEWAFYRANGPSDVHGHFRSALQFIGFAFNDFRADAEPIKVVDSVEEVARLLSEF